MNKLNCYLKYTETKSPDNDVEDDIFISGGLTTSLQSTKKVYHTAVYKLNLKSSKWELFSELKSKRGFHQSTIIGDNIYLIGGFNGRSCLGDTKIIPISKNDETLMPTIPTMHYKREQFGMCSFAGCIFVAGGSCNCGPLDKCEVYSTESCEWIEASAMNTKREAFALIYFQDKMWAIGGYSNKTAIDTIETYDLAKNSWTTIDTKLLTKRCGHSAVVQKNKVFVIGGIYQFYQLSSVELYSSETNQFSFVSPMSQARAFFGCSIFNNSLIVFGGELDENEVTDSVEFYDFEKQNG